MVENSQDLKNKLLQGSFFVLVGNLLGMGSIFVTRILAGRYLGPSEYGSIIIGLTLLETTSIFLTFGFPKGLAQQIPRRNDEKSPLTAALLLSVSTGVLISVLGILFNGTISDAININGDAQIISLFLGVLPFYLITKVLLGFIRGKEDVLGRFVVQNIGLQILVVIGVSVVVLMSWNVHYLALAWAGMLGVSSIIGVLYLRINFGPLLTKVGYSEINQLTTFSAPLLVSNALWLVLQKADNLLLAFYQDPTIVGIYDSSFTLGRVFLMFLSGLGFLFLPILSELDDQDRSKEISEIYKFATKWLVFAGLIPLMIFLTYPGEVLALIYGQSFTTGQLSLIILSCGFFSHCLTGNNGESLTAIGLVRTIAIGSFIAVFINILINIVLIPKYGMNGAAIASAIAYISVNLFYSMVLYQETGIQPISSELSKTVISTVIVIFAIKLLPYNPSSFIELTVVSLFEMIILCIIIITFGMDDSDWETFYNVIPNV